MVHLEALKALHLQMQFESKSLNLSEVKLRYFKNTMQLYYKPMANQK